MGVDPISLMLIGTAVGAVGEVASTVSGMSQASYQGAVAARNASIAEQNRIKVLEASQVEQQDWSADARQEMGSLLAGLSSSGIIGNAGTNAGVIAGQLALANRDALRTRQAGKNEAEGFGQQRADFQAEQGMASRSRRNALVSGVLGVGSTLIGGATAINRARGLVQ